MEKASSFFVIIINDLYDEVIYVNFKEIGKMLVTLLIIATTIYVLVEQTKYWPSVIVLAVILALWLQLVYHLFHSIKVGNKGVQISSIFDREEDKSISPDKLQNEIIKLKKDNEKLSSKIEEINKQLKKFYIIDYHEEFGKMIRSGNEKINTYPTPYESPVNLEYFLTLVSGANKSGFNYQNDVFYNKAYKQVRGDIILNLTKGIKDVYDTDDSSFYNVKALIEWCKVTPVSEKHIMAICRRLSAKKGKRDELTIQFTKAINDLKKIQAQ